MKTKTILLSTIFLALVVTTFHACRKYDEGPHISLRSRIGRLTGDWKAKSITADGVEQLHEDNAHSMICHNGTTLDYNYVLDVKEVKLTFTKDGKWNQSTSSRLQEIDNVSSYDSCAVIYRITDDISKANGTWEFINDEEQINFKFADNSEAEILNIKELREKELIIEMKDGEANVRMVLVKV